MTLAAIRIGFTMLKANFFRVFNFYFLKSLYTKGSQIFQGFYSSKKIWMYVQGIASSIVWYILLKKVWTADIVKCTDRAVRILGHASNKLAILSWYKNENYI